MSRWRQPLPGIFPSLPASWTTAQSSIQHSSGTVWNKVSAGPRPPLEALEHELSPPLSQLWSCWQLLGFPALWPTSSHGFSLCLCVLFCLC